MVFNATFNNISVISCILCYNRGSPGHKLSVEYGLGLWCLTPSSTIF